MASKTSVLIELLRTGSAQEVDQFLAAGYKPPADPAKHPILELFYLADPEYATAREIEGKLEAFLRNGFPADWKLPHHFTQSKKTRRLVSACLPRTASGHVLNNFKEANLLARAAGSGHLGMVEAVLKYGAKPFDQDGIAIQAAAQGKKVHTLLLLSERAQSDERLNVWGACTSSVIACAHKKNAPYLLKSWEKVIPPEISHEQREALFGKIFKEENSSREVSYWMESNPVLFARIHDPKYCSPDGVVGSFWPHALREVAYRGIQSPLFQMALSGDAAWLSTAVSSMSLRKWTYKTGEKGSLFSTTISLPPLQTLLHKTNIPADTSKRMLARAIKCLMDRGAPLWVGHSIPSSPATEAMLWAQSSSNKTKPKLAWLKNRPDWIAPHPITGETALATSLTTREADFWIDAGARLDQVDMLGNQIATSIMSRSCKYTNDGGHNVSSALEWAKWMSNGWEHRSFPVQGYANGKTMAEWSTFNMDAHQTLSKINPSRQAGTDALLSASILNLNTNLFRSLIEEGADPNATFDQGWNGMQHLAMWCSKSPNGTQAKSIDAILDVFDEMALQNGEFWGASQKALHDDPWQIITHGDALQALYDNSYPSTYPLPKLFNRLHAARCQDARLWKWEDAGHIIQTFSQQFELIGNLKLFAKDLPKEILDDLLLSMVNPTRSPNPDFDIRFLSYGQEIARILTSNGASWDGQDLQGNRLIDLWPEFQRSTASKGEKPPANSIVFMDEPKSVFEQHFLQNTTPTTLSSAKRARL